MKKRKQIREDAIDKSQRIEELNEELLEKERDVRAKNAKLRRLEDKVRLSEYEAFMLKKTVLFSNLI